MSWIGNEVLITFEGDVDFHDITEVDDKIYGDPRYEKQKYQLWDFQQVKTFKVNPVEARVIGVVDKNSAVWNNDIKLAVVATDEHVLNMTLEYREELKDTNWQVRIFESMDEARVWCLE